MLGTLSHAHGRMVEPYLADHGYHLLFLYEGEGEGQEVSLHIELLYPIA